MFAWRATGVTRYVRQLCSALGRTEGDATFFVYAPEPIEMPVAAHNWLLRVDPKAFRKRFKSHLWVKFRLGRLCRDDSLDVFWGSFNIVPPLPEKVRTLATVFDLNHLVVPDSMQFGTRWALKAFLAHDLRRADAVVTISQGTADRMRSMLGIDAAAVVRPAVSESFMPQSETRVRACLDAHQIRMPYLLTVGTWEPRKNLELLLRTFRRMKSEGLLHEMSLALAGSRGWKDARLASMIDRADDDVRPLGYVPDDD